MGNSELFNPIHLGELTLRNRIVLPPLTRCRSEQPGDIPGDLMVEYYRQRASAGFIITEGTQIEPRGQGYAWTPGIYTREQIDGWKKVTDSVHQAGGIIFCQLWHVGRVSHNLLQPGHSAPVAPSAIRANGVRVFIPTGPNSGELAEPSEPRALTNQEVKELVQLYRQAAINAMQAGFDGVELHSANGYLINQFISEHTNTRTDEYGGSLENRLRFLKEITEAVSSVFGSKRVGVRFSPLFTTTDELRVYLGLVERDVSETYLAAARMLDEIGIGYLSIAEADWEGCPEMPVTFREQLRSTFNSLIMYAGKFTADKASRVLNNGWGDLFGFGRTFIANPDLPERIFNSWPLNKVNNETLYGGGEKGYTDYPSYDPR